MKYRVYLSEAAEGDLADIVHYVAIHDTLDAAENLLTELEKLCLSLEQSPNRGSIPPELDRVNVRNFRQLHYKPYRLIYSIEGHIVYVHCILDGRRDLQDLLQRRLVR